MSAEATAELVAHESQVEPTLRHLREETMPWALAVPFVAGFAMLFNVNAFANPLQSVLPGAILYLLTFAAWTLSRWSPLAASWLVVIGCLVADLVVVVWGGIGAAIFLLALPVGLAAALVGVPGGLLTATVCSLVLLLAPSSLLRLDAGVPGVALLGTWGTVGLIWLSSRPLLTMLEWSWSSYDRSRTLLDQARDSQLRLRQTLQDLTDANRQLTSLNRLAHGLRQAAEDARRAKQQFAANVSHELRTPLNMIIGFTEMITAHPASYGKIPPALLSDLDVILRNSQHLASLIDDVLELSQLDAEQAMLLRERADFAEIVLAATTAVRPLFALKGLYLETEVPDNLVVFCDRTRVREVLLNLLTNAGRVTERGGVRTRAWRAGGDVVVSVADTGPGIDREDQPKVFEPFRQLDGSTRRRHGGIGLGLSISKSFVELHGGAMWLESEKGRGATFFFRLPIDAVAPVETGPSRWLDPTWEYRQRTHRARLPATVVAPRLLTLEPGGSLQRLLKRHLDGTEVHSVTSLEEAARDLAGAPARALVINDPLLSDALRLLPSAGLPNDTPVFVCSVLGPYEAAHDLGVSDYLVKPVSRDAVLAALARLPSPAETVLIVDDENDAQRLFRRMLVSAGRGYRVLRATDGRQALRVLRDERPDVVLLDLAMPGVDGFQFLVRKNADPRLRDIPVVVISARDPFGQPIVSSTLAVTRGDGLSLTQLLRCIETISAVLSPAARPDDRGPTGASAG